MNYTPGPWEHRVVSGGEDILILAGAESPRAGREITLIRYAQEGEANANARLIAAAPELLEACEAAIKYDEAIRSCANNPAALTSYGTAQGDSLDALYDEWMHKARAAIGNATGE